MQPNTSVQRYRRQASEEENIAFFGNTLTYECGLARRFKDVESDILYDERSIICNWNKTWTPSPDLDPCVWVACINPPSPPSLANIEVEWDGAPVNFTHNVSYSCSSEGPPSYFEIDKEMQVYNVSCLGKIINSFIYINC